MIGFIGWLSALVTLLTVLPMLQDAAFIPTKRDWRTLVHHFDRLAILVAIAACSGLLILYPSLRTASVYEVTLRVALALYLSQQTPHPWWSYVFGDTYRKMIADKFNPRTRHP